MGCGASTNKKDEDSDRDNGDASQRYEENDSLDRRRSDCSPSEVEAQRNCTASQSSAHVQNGIEVSNCLTPIGQEQIPAFHHNMKIHPQLIDFTPSCAVVDGGYLFASHPSERSVLLHFPTMNRVDDARLPPASVVAKRGNVFCLALKHVGEVYVAPLPSLSGSSSCTITHTADITALSVVSEDSFAVGDALGSITIFDLVSAQILNVVSYHRTPIKSIVLNEYFATPVIISSATERSVRIWEYPDGVLTNELPSSDQGCVVIVPAESYGGSLACVGEHSISLHKAMSRDTDGQLFVRAEASIFEAQYVAGPGIQLLFYVLQNDRHRIIVVECGSMTEVGVITLMQECRHILACPTGTGNERAILALCDGGALNVIDFQWHEDGLIQSCEDVGASGTIASVFSNGEMTTHKLDTPLADNN